jgi:hypothetical protein
MTPTLDYALMMLSCYTNDEPLNIEAISHYRQLAADERERLVIDMMEDDDDSL